MGNLVFQATLGGQVNLVGPNTASTFNLNVPATSSTLATLTGTETFTNKTLTSPTLTTPALGTPASGVLTNCTGLSQTGLASNVAGNGPAFSAYPSGSQSVTANTFTKLQYNTKEFDTNSNYDNATNYRFQPTVAGYYSFTAGAILSTVVSRVILSFYKNGTSFKAFDISYVLNTVSGASLIYLNGSTDYVELYGFATGTTPAFFNSSIYAFFQASLVRAA